MMKRLIACVVVLVILSSSISAYATRNMFEQIEAQPISQGEQFALQWMIITNDHFNYGFYDEMLWIMIALHLSTFLWVTYPWSPLPPSDPWLRK